MSQVAKNNEDYNMISSRYGADIATLTKLRFDEIHRLVVDELDENNAQNTESTLPENLTSLFLSKVTKLLEKDKELSNMFVEDAEIRLWAVTYFLAKPFAKYKEKSAANVLEKIAKDLDDYAKKFLE